MLNNEVREYITRRLQAGDSAADIAATIHAWGWGADTGTGRPQASIPKKSNSNVLPIVVGLSAAVLIVTSTFVLNLFPFNTYRTHSIAGEVVKPETQRQPPPKTSIADAQEPANADLESSTSATVLGASDLTADNPASSAAELTDTTNAAATDSATHTVSKSEYKMALIGDSMVDTLDSHLPTLSKNLEAKYHAKFKIYNYGVGAQNVEMGLAKFSQHFSYKDRDYPAVSELKPDIIIIGSFAYNPFSPHDVNKYWLTMSELAKNSQATGADVYFLADIAPVKEKFGVGSLEWSTDVRVAHSQKIIDQFNSFVALSKSLNIPLIDVFTLTQANGQFGSGTYTNSSDGIHANNAGQLLVVNQIAKDVVVK